MATRTFPLRVVLTVTTGRLLTERKGENDNGIGDLYGILGHMTGDSPFTHQLGRFAEECKPWLFRWFPELAKVETNSLDELLKLHGPEKGVEAWLHALLFCGRCKAEYEIGQIPHDDHDIKNPIDELIAIRGTDEGITIIETE
jgi:hypothetical protein